MNPPASSLRSAVEWSTSTADLEANIMGFLKALRRSIKGDKDNKPHISITPKSAVAIVPPKKVST